MLVCGDFSCFYICESALDGGEEIVVGLQIESPYEREREEERERILQEIKKQTAEE